MINKSGRTDAQNIQPIRENGGYGTNSDVKEEGQGSDARSHKLTKQHTHFEEN